MYRIRNKQNAALWWSASFGWSSFDRADLYVGDSVPSYVPLPTNGERIWLSPTASLLATALS